MSDYQASRKIYKLHLNLEQYVTDKNQFKLPIHSNDSIQSVLQVFGFV